MIHGIYLATAARLAAKGMPYEFTYGPPQVPQKVGETRLYMCADDETGDAILPARSQRRNPKQVAIRAIGSRVAILAHSTIAGADRHDHENLAISIANLVHVALDHVIRGLK